MTYTDPHTGLIMRTLTPSANAMRARALIMATTATDQNADLTVVCSWCARDVLIIPTEVGTPRLAMTREIVQLMEHCAYDHGGRSELLVKRTLELIMWGESGA